MMHVTEYFERYLGYKLQTISNDNLNPHGGFYETYRNLDDALLSLHAEQENDPAALEELGERSLFMKKDVASAITYLEKAAALGNGDASCLLSQIYRTEVKDWDKYFHYAALSAEQGSVMGLFNYACCHYKGKEAYEGHGMEQDKAKAAEWSERASDRAQALIHCILSTPCSNGFREYVDQLINIFVQSTCRAAEQYIDGDGIPTDLQKARVILTKANGFGKQHFNQEIPAFSSLLNEIAQKSS